MGLCQVTMLSAGRQEEGPCLGMLNTSSLGSWEDATALAQGTLPLSSAHGLSLPDSCWPRDSVRGVLSSAGLALPTPAPHSEVGSPAPHGC